MTTTTNPLHLGAYDFEGDPDDLLAGFDRLATQFPDDALLLQICIRREGGITIYDACPDHATFVAFSTSDEFLKAVADAGLPEPRSTSLGHVHRAVLQP